MRILLIGDFSGAHYNLKLALKNRGHDVLLYSNKDAYKQIPTDRSFYIPKPNENRYIASLKVIISQLRVLKEIRRRYDIIQLIAHSPFHHRINKWLVRKILKYNIPVVIFNAGCSYPYNKFVRTLEYSPCQLCKLKDLPVINKADFCPHETEKQIEFEKYVYNNADAIVSSHYEYFEAIQSTKFKNKNYLIPIPFPVNEKEAITKKPNKKIKVYLGITRVGFKGIPYFMQAIEEIKRSKYGKFFEFIVKYRLPYHKHKEVLKESDVLLDQANSYSYGVNALLGLSLGKIVFSGAEPEAIKAIGASPEECPIINTKPSSQFIKQKLLELLDLGDRFEEMQAEGIEFVKKHHSPKIVAEKYEKLYSSILISKKIRHET